MAIDTVENTAESQCIAKIPHITSKNSTLHCKTENNDPTKETNKTKHKHQGDYNTFVVPELLCQCQQKCTDRVTPTLIQKVCMYFFGMRQNRDKQKRYLASLILAREKVPDVNILKGKRLRKMSYRYFVPVLTDKDLKTQTEDNNSIVSKDKSDLNDATTQPENEWDHIEVCLKAFTSVHYISEKRVIVTRNVCKLGTTIKCSRPFPSYNIPITTAVPSASLNDKPDTSSSSQILGADISVATASWVLDYCRKNSTFAVNPKTYLPEGLILPDSIICLPIFSKGVYHPIDPHKDIDIVDNFFLNQLWKPEYIFSSKNN